MCTRRNLCVAGLLLRAANVLFACSRSDGRHAACRIRGSRAAQSTNPRARKHCRPMSPLKRRKQLQGVVSAQIPRLPPAPPRRALSTRCNCKPGCRLASQASYTALHRQVCMCPSSTLPCYVCSRYESHGYESLFTFVGTLRIVHTWPTTGVNNLQEWRVARC